MSADNDANEVLKEEETEMKYKILIRMTMMLIYVDFVFILFSYFMEIAILIRD